MSGMSKNDYISLLEQAVTSNANSSLTKGMDGVPGKTRRTGAEPGMKYRSASIGGDDIINWDGEGKLSHSEDLDDIDELMKGIKHESDDEFDDNDFSPMSILESASTDNDEEEELENDHLDVDEQMEESVSSANFTSTESEIISKLIREMNILETEGCGFDGDDDDDDRGDTTPHLDLDEDEDD